VNATERQIEQGIIDLLHLSGFRVQKTDAALIRRGTKKPRGMLTPGWPDLMAVYPGQHAHLPVCLLIEVKSATGTLSSDQVHCHALLRGMGIKVVVLHSIDEAQALIQTVKAQLSTTVDAAAARAELQHHHSPLGTETLPC
jgi:VRR-NUC domain